MSFLIGLLAGIFGGLVGVGGGIVMIPLMVGILKMGQHKAHGTSLVALVFTGISGAITYAMQGSIDLTASLLIAITAIFTARPGAHYAHTLAEGTLKRSFGVFMIVVSLLLLVKPFLPQLGQPAVGWAKITVLLATGIASGFLSGMMGVGGGASWFPLWCCWPDLLSTPRKEALCLPWFLPAAWALLPTEDWVMSTRR